MTILHFQKTTHDRLILGMLLLILPLFCLAKTPEKLDVVLIMDSSGSMKKTDPQQLRKPAAKLFISLLGTDDRASVVSFSDQGYPVAYLTPVKGEKNSKRLFDSVDKISTKGVYTNLSGAIDAAMKVLNRNRAPDRQRTIVLMSDGKMDMGNTSLEAQLTKTLLEQQTTQLKEMGVEVHTVAFTQQSDQKLLKRIAAKTGGKFYMAESDKDLHTVYTSIFEQQKAPNMVPFEGETFSLDKSVSEATVIGSKDSAITKLSLITPDGKTYTKENKPDDIKWVESAQFDLITINHPVSGKWQLQSSSGKNKAYVITDLKLLVDSEPKAPVVGEGVMIKVWLEEQGKLLSKTEVLADIDVKLQVRTPEGDVHELNMEPFSKYKDDPSSIGVYASHIAFPSQGQFQLEIGVSGATFKRERMSTINIGPVSAETTGDTSNSEHNQAAIAESDHNDVTTEQTADKSDSAVESTATEDSKSHSTESDASPAHTPLHNETEIKVTENHINLPGMPILNDQNIGKDLNTSDEKSEQPKSTDHKKEPAKTIKDTEKSKAEPTHDSKDSGMMLAIYAFIGINAFLAIIGGGIFFIMKRKKAKVNGGDSDMDLEMDLAEDDVDAKRKAA